MIKATQGCGADINRLRACIKRKTIFPGRRTGKRTRDYGDVIIVNARTIGIQNDRTSTATLVQSDRGAAQGDCAGITARDMGGKIAAKGDGRRIAASAI